MNDYRDPQISVHATDENACDFALDSVQAFLHGELPEATADEIRRHLMICENCMDDFDIEQTIADMVKRCCETPSASQELRMRVSSIAAITYRKEA